MANYQETLKRLQPIVPVLFDALEAGLAASNREHEREGLHRQTDPHFYAHTVRRHASELLMSHGVLATDVSGSKSALAMSGLQIQHNEVVLWLLRARDEVPLPGYSKPKQDFFGQRANVLGWDNVLLLWDDVNGQLAETLYLVRPLGGDHRRKNLRVEWDGPLRRDMAALRATDLDLLQPSYRWAHMGGSAG